MARAVGLLGRDHRFIALSVVPPTYVPASPLGPMDSLPAALPDADLEVRVEESEEAACASDLAGLVADLGVTAEQRVTVGDAGTTICTVAEEIGADVIVVGAHNRGMFKRLLLGSTSKHVVKHAPCCVLVVHPEDRSKVAASAGR